MGSFSSKTKTTSNQTATPVTPAFIQAPVKNYTGKIDDFMNMDPSQFVAGPSQLQQQAFTDAQGLGGWQDTAAAALGSIQNAGARPAAQATAGTAGAVGVNAPKIGAAAQAQGVNVGPATNAEAFLADNASILDRGIEPYMDPAINAYVQAALANYDDSAGRQNAAFEAQAAKSGAFGGSRMGVAQAELAANQTRGRALTDAELRAQAFRDAAGLAATDASLAQQANISNAGIQTGVSQTNAGAANQMQALQAQLAQQLGLANTGFQNEFKLGQAQLDAQAASQTAANKQQSSIFNTAEANQASQFNAQMQEQQRQAEMQSGALAAQIAQLQQSGSAEDLALAAQLGEMQRAIEQAQKNALPTQLQIGGAALGSIPYPAFVGQNVSGTSTTKTNPGWGNILATAAGSALSAYASGGMKF